MTTIDLIPAIELKYLANKEFKTDVLNIRRMFGINDNGIEDIGEIIDFDQKLRDADEFAKNYILQVGIISKKYHDLENTIDLEMFVETGRVPVSGELHNITAKTKKTALITKPVITPYRWPDQASEVSAGLSITFKIRDRIKLTHLDNWFATHGDTIVQHCEKHFITHTHKVEEIENWEMLAEIIRLRNEEKMPYAMIADNLCKMYPHDVGVKNGKINEQSVKMRYLRHVESQK